MPRLVSCFSHNLFYTSEVSSIIRGHHLYMSVWSSTVGETLSTRPDNREEAKDYDKFAIVVYKGDLLAGHEPIEISSLFYHLNNNEQNTLTVIVTEKRIERLILLCSETILQKNLFPTMTLKFRKNGINRKFPFHATKRKYKIELEPYCFFLLFLLVFWKNAPFLLGFGRRLLEGAFNGWGAH